MRLRPFFSYYGSKWRLAPLYPSPEYETVIEAFAGSAGYATLYPQKRVWLFDINPVIVGVWDFLIKAPSREITKLPVVFDHVDDLIIPQEAKWFLGFWITKAVASPRKQFSKWVRDYPKESGGWAETTRSVIAAQQQHIRHWKVMCGTYDSIPPGRATYFIDPPYQRRIQGKHYPYNDVDYSMLSACCKHFAQYGQVIACEEETADWLPFVPLRKVEGRNQTQGPGSRNYTEVVCVLNGGTQY